MIAVLSDPKCGSNLGQVGARTGRLEQCIEVSGDVGPHKHGHLLGGVRGVG